MARPSLNPTAVPDSGRRGPSIWAWLIVATAMLASSGAVKGWQERRMVAAATRAVHSPFPLARLPLIMGGWKARGDDITLDTKTLQIAGCSDYASRVYTDEKTGVSLTVLVAYGPAEKLVGHTPAVCYPAVGFRREVGPIDRALKVGDGSARFRSFVFVKPEDGFFERLHVYAGFLHEGRWSPDAEESRKRFRHEPGMFKIQIQRRLGRGERCDPGNPIEQFLTALLPELDRSLAASRRSPAG